MQLFRGQAQHSLQGFEVLVVLAQGVLELKALFAEGLGPAGLAFAALNHPAHVFGFQHEHPIHGHEHMVDLRRAGRGAQGNVMECLIGSARKPTPCVQLDQQLAKVATGPGGLGQPMQQPGGDKPSPGDNQRV